MLFSNFNETTNIHFQKKVFIVVDDVFVLQVFVLSFHKEQKEVSLCLDIIAQ